MYSDENLFLVWYVVFPWIYQLFFWLFKLLIIRSNLGLKFSVKFLFRRWMFRGDSKHFFFNVFWWECFRFQLLFSIKIYKFFFWWFKIFIRWRNLALEFAFNVFFRRWMLRGEWQGFYLFFDVLVNFRILVCNECIYRFQFLSCLSNLSLCSTIKMLMVLSRSVCVS